jgi:hypothetical protein
LTVRYSITVDGQPRFRRQAIGWLATAAARGGVSADQIVVQCTDAVPDDYRRAVCRSFGVEVVTLPGGPGSAGTLNKVRQLAHPALVADWIVLCDCDTVFVEPIPAAVFGPCIAAKLVDVAFPGIDFWTELLQRLGLLNGLPEARRVDRGGGLTYRNNCNGGLYVGDSAHWAVIGPEWQSSAAALPGWITTEPRLTYHYDQIAFGVACAWRRVDVELLPKRLNFPFHEDPPAPIATEPVILHHHQSLENGRLICQPGHEMCPGVLIAVAQVNAILDEVAWNMFGL